MRLALVLVVWLAGTAALAGQQSSVELVLARMREYLVMYERQLSAVVAEERYEQRVSSGSRPITTGTGRGPTRSNEAAASRVLESDFLMMRWPGEAAWFGFRDVRLVDGQAVRDREDRLVKLFVQNPKDLRDRAEAIAAESARYNIGDVFRNINVPTQVLDFLHPPLSLRFDFRKTGEETLDGVAAWKLAYEERERPYLISSMTGAGVRAAGLAWVDPIDGSVLQTQLNLNVAESRRLLRTQITVKYRVEPSMSLRVPIELAEIHEQSDPSSRAGSPIQLSGRAQYGNFRRFQTSSQESIKPDP